MKSQSVRISKALLNSLPNEVSEQITSLQEDYQNIKSLTLKEVDTKHKFYVGEGDRFIGIWCKITSDFQVVSSDTVGASGVSHKIGSVFTMPDDSFLIHITYYNRYFMDLYHIMEEQ